MNEDCGELKEAPDSGGFPQSEFVWTDAVPLVKQGAVYVIDEVCSCGVEGCPMSDARPWTLAEPPHPADLGIRAVEPA